MVSSVPFLGLGLSGGSASAGSNPILGFLPEGYWKYNTGITVTGAGVSQWNDQSGNARHLLQATDAARPPLQGDGSVLFDGAAQFLRAAYTRAQPRTTLLLIKQISWTTGDRIFDGVTGSQRVQQAGTTPAILQAAPSTTNSNAALVLGSYGRLASCFNGVSSYLRVNATNSSGGDAGANSTDGITIGANAVASPANFSNIQVKEIADYAAALTQAQVDAIFAYWATL